MGVVRISYVFLCLTCLQSISSASPLISVAGEKKGGEVGVSGSNPSGVDTTFTTSNSFAESSVLPSSSDPRELYVEGGMVKGGPMRKRDKEEEADSANGKSPIPFLFKKSPKASGNGEESRVFGNEFEFSEFPPLVGRMEAEAGLGSSGQSGRYQRQRRSSFTPEEEDERRTSADDVENREAFMRMMISRLYGAGGGDDKAYLLLNKGGEPLNKDYVGGNREFQFGGDTAEDAEDDEDEEGSPLPFGYKPISLMSSTAGDSAGRIGGVHLSGVPGSHGFYLASHQEQPKPGLLHLSQLGATYPLSIVRPGGVNRELGLGDYSPDENDGGNAEWMDNSIPLVSSLKSRRSDGNNVFTFNPVKSHFRRINRIPLDGNFGRNYNFGDDNGPYRSFAGARKRRSSSLHYM